MKRYIDKWLLAGLAFGAFMGIVALLAPKLGLGQAYDFVLYRAFGLSRRGLLAFGVLVILLVSFAWLMVLAGRAGLLSPIIGWSQRTSVRILEEIKAALAMPLGSALRVLAINLVVFCIALVGIEIAGRNFLPEPKIYGATQPGQYFRFQPYLQSSNEGPLDHDGVWFDPLHNERIPYHVKSNSLGFRVDREFDTTTVYQKAESERVVLIFGGSAVYGFGNTSNETTGAGWLERKLNEAQSRYRYKVFNMGNGGWVSYQQLIALNLYGLNLNPDWVIFMDARNDIFTLPALAGDDVGFHFSTPALRNLIDGYYYRQPHVDFYRGSFENGLLRHSAVYRYISGKQYVPQSQASRFPVERDWKDIDRTIDFYLRTQRSVLLQCPSCQFILSSQPIYRSGRKSLSADERASLKATLPDLRITSASFSDPHFEDVLMYAYGRIANEMPSVCGDKPNCTYKDMNDVFPTADSEKQQHFVDDVHLRDTGNEIIASYYASVILDKDGR